MSQKAYIVTGFRSAVGKAGKGGFRFYRPDDLAADVIKHLVASVPQLDKNRIDDVIVGNATPEAEQGLNMGRLISLMGLKIEDVPGVTVNRYCAKKRGTAHRWVLTRTSRIWLNWGFFVGQRGWVRNPRRDSIEFLHS